MGEATSKVDTERVRVTEWRLPPRDETGHHVHAYDYVVVPLTGGELTVEDVSGNTSRLVTEPGDAYARTKGVEHNVRNLSDQEVRFTEIELL